MGSMAALAKQAPVSEDCAGCAINASCIVSRLLAARRGARGVPRRQTLRAREVLFREGQPCGSLFLVTSGVIALRKLDVDGGSMLMELAHPGDVLDYGVLSPETHHHTTAVATFQSEVCTTPATVLRDAIRSGGSASLALMQQLAQELERHRESLLQRVTVPSQMRLQHALLLLVQHHGEQLSDGSWRVELPVKRCDLASMIGMRPETISRVLRSIEEAKLAHFSGRHVVIPDLDALRASEPVRQSMLESPCSTK